MAKITQVINGESGLNARNKINNALASVDTADVTDGAVTYAKIQDISATDKVLGRSTAGAGDIEEITMTAAGRALIDDADAAAQRTTLGVQIGVDVQAYSPNYALINQANSWTFRQDFAVTTSLVPQILKSSSFTISASDAGATVFYSSASTGVCTIPNNATYPAPLGTVIAFVQSGTGLLDFDPGAGVTLRSKNNNRKVAAQWASVALQKIDTDEWLLVGDLIA